MNPHAFSAATLAALLCSGLTSQQGEAKPDKQPTPEKKETLAIGDTLAADVKLTDLDGKEFKFADARGKIVVLHFWSISCPWEKVAEPKLQQIATDYKDKDVLVLAVNANANEIGAQPDAAAFAAKDEDKRPYASIRKHTAQVDFNHRVLVDHSGDFARLIGGRTTPHCFVIDREGKLAYSGALDNDGKGELGDRAEMYVRLAVDALRAGKPVEKPTTRPYG